MIRWHLKNRAERTAAWWQCLERKCEFPEFLHHAGNKARVMRIYTVDSVRLLPYGCLGNVGARGWMGNGG